VGCLGTSTIAGATGGSGAANELETEAAENVTTPVEAYAMLPLKMLRVLPVEHGNLSSSPAARQFAYPGMVRWDPRKAIPR
jgi:hypothetical protein